MRARTERLVGAVAVVLATGLVLASIGAADNSKAVPYANSALNTCNGEFVVVEGTIFMDEQITTDGRGTHSRFNIHLSDVKGIALVTGARYVQTRSDTGSSYIDFDGAPSEFTHIETIGLTRLGEDGTADDFRYHLTAHVTINANGVPTADPIESRIDCD